ncbi:MAG: pentapeptide repeat-containing protein [Symploca sp. SIO3E6]|nr:pentapeptide repeat-containing protein [Caldora sp. SIO3E6]
MKKLRIKRQIEEQWGRLVKKIKVSFVYIKNRFHLKIIFTLICSYIIFLIISVLEEPIACLPEPFKTIFSIVKADNIEGFSILFVALFYIVDIGERRQRAIDEAWQVVHAAAAAKIEISYPPRIKALQDLNRYGESLKSLKAPKANLENINLEGADLQGANLQGANLQGANLQRVDLEGANLEGADLQGAQLQGADLYNTNLQGAQFQGTNLQKAKLQKAKLQKAKLQKANLQDAKLRKAELQEADLQGANLKGADLKVAKLQGANLQGANIEEAEVEQAEFGHNQVISQEKKAKLIQEGAKFNTPPN